MKVATKFIFIILLFYTSILQAQYYFGRNKVQYEHFKWYVLKTEHFDIYFYPEMQELAEIGAASAERTYRTLEDKFNHNINRKIPLIFYSNQTHFQQTNTIPYLLPEGVGGFFEFIKGRVVVPANGSIPDFERVIRHELIHVFTHSLHYRTLKNHRRIHYPALPLWFVEGLAEYWSIGWNEEAEMFIKDAVLNGYLVPLQQMYQIYGSFLMYKEGQAILKYIADTYGEEKILQLITNTWKEDNFSNVMKLTIGLNYEEFDREWLYHLKKQFYPIMDENDFPEMVAKKITLKGINTKPAFFLKNEKPHVAFVSNRIGYSNIYQMPIPKQAVKKEEPGVEVIVKGERTAEFESFHILNSKIDVNEQGELVFISKSGGSDVLYIYDIHQQKIINNLKFDNIVTLYSPSWSDDNQKLAFTGISYSGKSDIYIIDIDSGRLSRLTNDFYNDRDPVWDKNSDFLYFSSDRTMVDSVRYYNIFSYDLNTGAIGYITYSTHNDYTPAVSPDNQFLAFTSDRDGALNIWITENKAKQQLPWIVENPVSNKSKMLSGFAISNISTELRKITNFTTGAHDPDWTNDNGIVFTAFEKFSFQIQILENVTSRFDTSQVVQQDSLHLKNEYWKMPKIVAQSIVTTMRYRPKFNLDVAQSAIMQDPMFGTSGGAQVALSDMLGNYQYHFLVFNNAQTKDEFLESFNVAVSRLDLSHRTNYALGLYHFAGRYFNWYDGFFYERRYGGFASVSYPLSTFKRIEGSINFRKSYKEWYGLDHSRDALLLSNFIGIVKDNSLWGPTGPVDGERLNLTLGNTTDIQHSNVNFYTIIADARKYFRLSRRTTFALRAMTRYNHGKEALRFYMGGSWDLRGYQRWSLWGKKTFLINNELRFPFIDRFMINFPFGGMAFSAIRGASFVDFGNAWDNRLDQILGSAGFGIRFRIGGILVLRYDFGKKFRLTDTGNLFNVNNIKVDSGMFQQFFFGWDF